MQKTVYQAPELRDDNNNIIRDGAYGRNTAFCTPNNKGVLDYVNNNLEWLYDNKLNVSAVGNSIANSIRNSNGLDKTNLDSLLNSITNTPVKNWEEYSSASYSPEGNNAYWKYIAFGGSTSNYSVLFASKANENSLFLVSGNKKEWTRVETVSEFANKYIRYASGLQITFESINSGATNVVNGYTFPAPFIALPVVSVDGNSNIAVHATGLTATGCNIQLPNNTTARTVHIVAIGRWK